MSKECDVAKELRGRMMNAVGVAKKRFKELLESHKKSCPICKGK